MKKEQELYSANSWETHCLPFLFKERESERNSQFDIKMNHKVTNQLLVSALMKTLSLGQCFQ